MDWGLSGINLNNSFTASVIYDLPFGKGKHFGSSWSNGMNTALGNWQVTIIEKITSGFPVFIVDSNNTSGASFLNGNANALIRPNEIGNPNQGGGATGCPSQVHTVANWFNPCAFALPAGGQLGNQSVGDFPCR